MNFFKTQIKKIKEQDPSIHTTLETLIHPSFKVMFYYKISHFLYNHKLYFLARKICYHAKKITGIEIHPGATISDDLFIDHGLGVVIGETAVVGKNVIMYHGVTLGARNRTTNKRHPTIKDNVLLGCNSTILGNITIGNNVSIGANTIVLENIEDNKTVVGINRVID